MIKQTLVTATICLSMSLGANAAVNKKTSAKLKKSDITSILKSDAEKNILVVETKNGQIYKLKVSEAQRKELEGSFQVASTSAVKAPASVAATKPAATVKKAVSEIKAPEKKPSPWSFGAFYGAFSGMEGFNNGTGSIFNYLELGIGYQASNGLSYSFNPNVGINYKMEAAESTTSVGDPTFTVSKGSLTKFGDINMSGSLSYTLPISSSTRASGSRGAFGGSVGLSTSLTDAISVSYSLAPSYHLQTKRVVVDFDDFGRLTGTPEHNTTFELANSLKVKEKVAKSVSLSQSIAHKYKRRYTDFGLEEQKPSSVIQLGADISWSGLGFATLIFKLSQTHSLNSDSEEGFALLKASESSYALMAFIPL